MPIRKHKDFVVCRAHKDWLDQTNKSKIKAKLCDVPRHLSRYKEGKPILYGERQVTPETMLKIKDATGVLLPIGTGKFKTRTAAQLYTSGRQSMGIS